MNIFQMISLLITAFNFGWVSHIFYVFVKLKISFRACLITGIAALIELLLFVFVASRIGVRII